MCCIHKTIRETGVIVGLPTSAKDILLHSLFNGKENVA
jgi:hypothetical protein